jgi:hypothetical protein
MPRAKGADRDREKVEAGFSDTKGLIKPEYSCTPACLAVRRDEKLPKCLPAPEAGVRCRHDQGFIALRSSCP